MSDTTTRGNAYLTPGAVVGIVGGGQLGRMMAIAASRLGFFTAVLSPDVNAPAVQVSHRHIKGDYDNRRALSELTERADVLTYELEQIPLEGMQWVSENAYLAPNIHALDVSQDRVKEKAFLNSNGVPTTAWKECRNVADVKTALSEFACDSILKVAFGGYDGKGQEKILRDAGASDIAKIWDRLSLGQEMVTILEATVDFDCEISVVVARDKAGNVVPYDPVRNHHENHILATTIVPAGIDPAIGEKAQTLAKTVASALEYVGVMCLEMFVTTDGELLANEIAPRPHNSGHWTLDACFIDQFEQHIRAICGLPLGSGKRFADATMQNILGTEREKVGLYFPNHNARVHLYGKEEWRPGRKMGHVTILDRLLCDPAA
ncbi:MAG: 5-(carboxyamino)imidazole ribonucleotide synthase [Pseudomonadota bacterium]|nr:5-(carboxyamino)imidazole ribonucleotide synthase [Pseudomonadota bacterium]